jgi:exonuclease SbcC
MIPILLSLSGFLSYRDPVELDFSSFDLACIAGANGAGKSSLLDAMTWALFGAARKKDDSLINAQSNAAEVSLVFAYEGNIYRIQRLKPREKTTVLEFQILQQELSGTQQMLRPTDLDPRRWRPLSERSLRETEARIRQVLRLDYDTFVNASFFLQGKADQFTQQPPGDRKRILSSILGLETWEVYRQRAYDRRRQLEVEIANLDGKLHDIQAELGEEQARKARQKELEAGLASLNLQRQAQEAALESVRRMTATLNEQQKLVDNLERQLHTAEQRLAELAQRLSERQAERQAHAAIIARTPQIEAAHAAWMSARAELERWALVASQFHQHSLRRQEPLQAINSARARLEQELKMLGEQAAQAQAADLERQRLQPQIDAARPLHDQWERELEQINHLDTGLQLERQSMADRKAENKRLWDEMDGLKRRIEQLSNAGGAACPLCGQPLSADDRGHLLEDMEGEGRRMGDQYRLNQAEMRAAETRISEVEKRIASRSKVDAELRRSTQALAQLTSRAELLASQVGAWQANGLRRMQEIEELLQHEAYAQEERLLLAQIDSELKAIGYDAAAHDVTRRREADTRSSQDELNALARAQAALAPLDSVIQEQQAELEARRLETIAQQGEYQQHAASLHKARQDAPDLYDAESQLYHLQEQENRMRLEVGAARQKVLVLEDLKNRRKNLENQRESLALQIGQYKQLERAFGKDGVPALLIEQSLPQIESKANELLARLTNGSMTVRFITQAAYKDRRREDLRETLEIQISDPYGVRDYEMYSGGEAFRVNFAIRLALSEVLAQRAGARLQTLVIDEGFGSQDASGRQRLIQAISEISSDFAKILVITHIDELKDQFPNRIEVEKTERGSSVRVI